MDSSQSPFFSKGIDAIYEQVRRAVPAPTGSLPEEVRQVRSRIRVLALRSPTLPPATHTNAYVVGPAPGATSGPVAVVDPGSPYPAQGEALVRALAGFRVELVLLTHHHGDHVGGAVALAAATGAPIAAHAITAELLRGVVPVARTIADGETLAIGDARVVAVHTPGHAAGHLCFEVAGDGDPATIAGDMVAGLGTILIDPDEGDMAAYLASLELLLARPAGGLLPAHGPMIDDGPAKLREYLAHRRMREARVLAAIASRPEPWAIGELVAIVYADTPPALWVIAERSLAAHVNKLVDEGRVRTHEKSRYSAA